MSRLDPPTFAIHSTPVASTLLLEVVGDVDMTTAPALSKAVDLAPDGIAHVVIDLSEVSFLDSSGLNALVQSRRALFERNITMRVVVPAEGAIRRVFEITQLTEPLNLVDTRPPLQ